MSIPGTQFADRTDREGRYSVPFAPGRFKVDFNLEGYTSAQVDLDLATAVTLPAEQVTLAKIPPETGIYAIGETTYKRLPSAEMEAEVTKCDKLFTSESLPTPFSKYTYRVDADALVLDPGKEFTFLDTAGVDLALVAVDDEGSLLEQWIKGGATKSFGFAVEETGRKELVPGAILRTFVLAQGRYAFVRMRMQTRSSDVLERASRPLPDDIRLSAEPLYLFEVRNQRGAEEPNESRQAPLIALLQEEGPGGCACYFRRAGDERRGDAREVFQAEMDGPAWMNLSGERRKLTPVVPAPGCKSRESKNRHEMRYRDRETVVRLSLESYPTCPEPISEECEVYGLRGQLIVRMDSKSESLEIDGRCGC